MNGSVEIKIKQKHFEAKSREKNTRPEKYFAGSDNCNTNVTRYQIIKQDPMLQRDLFFFLSGFSFTNIHESQDCRGTGRVFLKLLTTTSTYLTST